MCHVHDEMKTVLVWVLGVGCWVAGPSRFLSANLLGGHQ